MRVQYTIPGWEPAPAAARPGTPETGGAFETKLRESSTAMPPGSAEILGLKRPKIGELALTPPPRPASLAYSDIDENRRLNHNLLSRHEQQPPDDPAAYQMLVLLAELQRMEDAVTARSLVDSRG